MKKLLSVFVIALGFSMQSPANPPDGKEAKLTKKQRTALALGLKQLEEAKKRGESITLDAPKSTWSSMAWNIAKELISAPVSITKWILFHPADTLSAIVLLSVLEPMTLDTNYIGSTFASLVIKAAGHGLKSGAGYFLCNRIGLGYLLEKVGLISC